MARLTGKVGRPRKVQRKPREINASWPRTRIVGKKIGIKLSAKMKERIMSPVKALVFADYLHRTASHIRTKKKK